MINPAHQNLIRINDPSPSGRSRVAGLWRGPESTPLGALTREVVRAAESLHRNAHDIRGNRNFGPVETGTRLREAAAPTLASLNVAATKIRAAKTALSQQMAALNPVRPYERSGHHQPLFDLRMVDHYHALPLSQRAALDHEMRLNPVLHLDLAEAMLRVPREIAGINNALRDEIRLGLQKTLKHQEFEQLDVQVDQLHVAETALRHAIDATRETTGNMSDLIEHAPEAFRYANSSEDAQPLRWLTPPPPSPAVGPNLPVVGEPASSTAVAAEAGSSDAS